MEGIKFKNNKVDSNFDKKFNDSPKMLSKKLSFVSFLTIVSMLIIGLLLIITANILAPYKTIDKISSNNINPALNGKNVIVQGSIEGKNFVDDIFGISQESIYLKRIVQLYQQTDAEGKIGIWSEKLTRFTPPDFFHIFSKEQIISPIKLGEFNLDKQIQEKILTTKKLDITQEIYDNFGDTAKKVFKLVDKGLYFGVDPSHPKIGDFKVSFEYVPYSDYTIFAKLQGTTLVPTDAKTFKVIKGKATYDKIIQNISLEKNNNIVLLIRIVGSVLILIALAILLFFKLPKKNKQLKKVNKNSDSDNIDEKKTTENIKNNLKKKVKIKKPKIKKILKKESNKNKPIDVNLDEDDFPVDTIVIDEHRELKVKTETDDEKRQELQLNGINEIKEESPDEYNIENQDIDYSLSTKALDHYNNDFELPEGVEIIGIDNLDISPTNQKPDNKTEEKEEIPRLVESFVNGTEEKESDENPDNQLKDKVKLAKSFKYENDEDEMKESIVFDDDKPMFEISREDEKG